MKSHGIDGPFPQKMSLRELFCALVVAIVADSAWQLSALSEGIYRHRNVVEFEVFPHLGQVIIIDTSRLLTAMCTYDILQKLWSEVEMWHS